MLRLTIVLAVSDSGALTWLPAVKAPCSIAVSWRQKPELNCMHDHETAPDGDTEFMWEIHSKSNKRCSEGSVCTSDQTEQFIILSSESESIKHSLIPSPHQVCLIVQVWEPVLKFTTKEKHTLYALLSMCDIDKRQIPVGQVWLGSKPNSEHKHMICTPTKR